MRQTWVWVAVGVLACTRVEAQSALEGPLAASDAPLALAHTAPARKTTKPKAHATAKRLPSPEASDKREAVPTETSSKQAPGDPVSFGMKWNGSNDNPEQTRVQDYNGGAQGTGAEVGMKLHF